MSEQPKITVYVYIDDGRVFEYEVSTPAKAREHASAIIKTGYVTVTADAEMEHYPPHRISKVKATGIGLQSNYYDKVRGT